MRQTIEYAIHLALIVAFLAGLGGNEGVLQMFRFFAWVVIVIMLIGAFVPRESRIKSTTENMEIDPAIVSTFQFILVCLLAYNGWFWTAGFYAATSFVSGVLHRSVREEILEKAPDSKDSAESTGNT